MAEPAGRLGGSRSGESLQRQLSDLAVQQERTTRIAAATQGVTVVALLLLALVVPVLGVVPDDDLPGAVADDTSWSTVWAAVGRMGELAEHFAGQELGRFEAAASRTVQVGLVLLVLSSGAALLLALTLARRPRPPAARVVERVVCLALVAISTVVLLILLGTEELSPTAALLAPALAGMLLLVGSGPD